MTGRQGRLATVPTEPIAVGIVLCLCIQSLGPIVVVLELLLLVGLILVRSRAVAGELARQSILLALPAFAILSTLWSPVAGTSLRYGIQLLLTIMMGVAVATAVRPAKLPLVLFFGLGASLLAGLASGRTGLAIDGAVLIGFTGSKNQMGFISLFWVIASACVLASRNHGVWMRLLAMLALPLAMFLVWQSKSMTALVSMVGVLALMVVLVFAARLPMRGRQVMLVIALLGAVPLFVAKDVISERVEHFTIDTLGKDTRLTGRTLLWEQADVLIAQKPLAGWGFKAIWLGPQGKGLLDRFEQKDGRAFNFHDTVREIRVDLGWVGLLFFALPIGVSCVRALAVTIAGPTAASAMATAILAVTLFRFRTDLVLAPFLADSVFLFAAIATLAVMNHRPSTSTLRQRTR